MEILENTEEQSPQFQSCGDKYFYLDMYSSRFFYAYISI